MVQMSTEDIIEDNRRHGIGEDKSVGFLNLDIKLRTRALVNKDIH